MSGMLTEKYRPAIEDEFLEFYRENLPTFDIFQSLWEWRKTAPPEWGPETAVVARIDGRIVGSVGIMKEPLILDGRKIEACWQQDSLVSRAARGKGVGRALVEAAAEGWQLLMAKGTSRAMYALRKAAGFVDVKRSGILVHVLRPSSSPSRGPKNFGEMTGWVLARVLGTVYPAGAKLSEVPELNDSLELMTAYPGEESCLRPVKDRNYLKWRYFECPVRRYTVLADGGVHPPSVIVLSTSREGSEDWWITDMLCPWRSRRTAYGLICGALAYLRARGARRLFVFSTLPAARRRFLLTGFVPTFATPQFTMRPASPALLPSQLHADFWHGDGDVELYAG